MDLLITVAIAAAVAIAGCGGEGGSSTATTTGGSKAAAAKGGGEYEEVLAEMRDTAAESGSYDGYGFAEYMPSTQRAAIDAFCFVADAATQGGPTIPAATLWPRVVRKAEADLKSERDVVAPAPAHRAIAKLRAVFGLESLDPDLAGRYVHACYR